MGALQIVQGPRRVALRKSGLRIGEQHLRIVACALVLEAAEKVIAASSE
jgi:hypothetical protein